MIRRATPLLASVALGGCASMTVNVDILRPTYAATAAAAARERAAVAELFTGNARPRASYVAQVVDKAIQIRIECYAAAATRIKQAIASGKLTPEQSALYQATLDKIANVYATPAGLARSREVNFTDFTSQFAAIDETTRQTLVAAAETRQYVTSETTPITPAIGAALDDHLVRYNRLATEKLQEQQQCQYLADQRATIAKSQGQVAILADADNRAFGQPLDRAAAGAVNDKTGPLATPPPTILGEGVALTGFLDAYWVASAPPAAWQRKFNVAQGEGKFGSSDIVVKLNQAADFTVKGFTFDARSTADMVAKAGIASIKLLAEAYGMPLPIGGAGATGSATTTTSPSPRTAADLTLAVAKARETAFDASLRSVANLILSDWARLTAGDAAAQTALKASFDASKDAWNAPASPPAK